MRKIDALLKKVEVFEKLAVYGDRKHFLQALSQNLPKLVVPNEGPPGSGGHWVDPNVPAEVPPVAEPVDRDPNLGLLHPMPGRATPEKNAPVAKAPAASSPNPKVKLVQQFLNNEIRNGVAALPVQENGVWSVDVANSLKDWAKAKGMPTNLNQAFMAALNQSK